MKYRVHWQEPESGKSGVYEGDFPDGEFPDEDTRATVLYMWEGGNYGCDCNRSLVLLDLPWEESYDCNTGENRIQVTRIDFDEQPAPQSPWSDRAARTR